MTGVATQSEFAQIMGWTKGYVSQLKKAGRLVLTDAGLVDVDASRARISATRDPNRDDTVNRHAAARAGGAAQGETVKPGTGQEDVDGETIVDFQTARALKENYLARQAKIDYEERTGKLIDAEKAAQTQFEMAREVRDSMLAIPARVQDILASLSDPVEIGRMLTMEIRQALESAAKKAGEMDDAMVSSDTEVTEATV